VNLEGANAGLHDRIARGCFSLRKRTALERLTKQAEERQVTVEDLLEEKRQKNEEKPTWCKFVCSQV
jgi:hypothetical protein